VNLFRQEQVNELIKQKRREHEMERNGGLEVPTALDDKRTAKIGEMVAQMQRPWYVKAVKPEGLEDGRAPDMEAKKAYNSLD
jgi:hypothetical protein